MKKVKMEWDATRQEEVDKAEAIKRKGKLIRGSRNRNGNVSRKLKLEMEVNTGTDNGDRH